MGKRLGNRQWRWLNCVCAFLLLVQLAVGTLAAPLPVRAAAGTPAADSFIEQPGGTTKWIVAGSFTGWNNGSASMQLKHLAGGFYAFSTVLPSGHHEFKLVKLGTWDGFSNNGNNFSLDLAEDTKVNFYINEELNQARINLPGVEGLIQYTPVLTDTNWPRLVGDIQPVFGEGVWSPGEAGQLFVDYNFDNTVYKLQRSLPAGKYEAKAVFGSTWQDENYGANGSNLVLNLLDPADVTFTIDYSGARNLTHDYVPANSAFDGLINKGSLSFDSRSITYKKPFGAIRMGQEDVTLRIAAQQGDVQFAKVELTNPDGGSNAFAMHKVTSVNNLDYFEGTIPRTAFTRIGVWGYKFILVDGSTKVEYGDDSSRGGTGAVVGEGAVPYDLTVYAPDYATPDWMKNAVVYQIFPDRFFDGDPANNRAKTYDGSRGANAPEYATANGGQKLQYFDGGITGDPTPGQVWGGWQAVPENPDRLKAENKPYYPDAKSDGAWTNEFYGGDLEGIKQKLGYLKATGITALYLNPVAWAASNHKYDATDYGHLDPMFGQPVYNTPGDPASGLDYAATRAASDRVYAAFAKAARESGMHIINDGVFNHVGDDSIYFDRYGKYPEIGAYEYWAKVYDKMNAESINQAQAEQAVRSEFTGRVNPLTGVNYKYPEDFSYITWFTVLNDKVKNRDDDGFHYKYDAWWGYDSLPAIDAKLPQTEGTAFFPADAKALPGMHEWNNIGYREAVIGHDLSGLGAEAAEQAMQTTNSQRWEWLGASGWRLDVAPDVSSGTWQQFRKAVKSTEGRTDVNGNGIEEPVLLGEEWGVATKYLLGDQFDSVMNYRFRSAIQSFLISGDAATMNQALESIREDYPKEAWLAMLNLVDSHDTTRSITKYDHPEWEEEHLVIAPEASDRALQLQALTAVLQMGYPGAPTIYYGDEVGVTGTKDPDSRRTFPWERITDNGDGSYSGTGRYAGLYGIYSKAAALRNDNEVLRTGDLKVAYAEGDVIVYARKSGGKGALVAVNRGISEQTVMADVVGFLPEGLELADELGGSARAVVAGGKISLTVPAATGMTFLSTSAMSELPKVEQLQAAGQNGSVALSWSPSVQADGYRVYRSAIEGGSLQFLGEAGGASFVDSAIVNGTKYYYTVTAKQGVSESAPSPMVAATPAYSIASVQVVQEAVNMTAGVGKLTSEIQVAVNVPGLTNVTDNVYKQAPGLVTKLIYYPDIQTPDQASEVKLRYKTDGADGSKLYWAQFEPAYAGYYHYQAQVSANNGESYTSSSTVTMEVYADPAHTTLPLAPVLQEIPVESNMTHLTWELPSDSNASGIEVYRQDGAGTGVFRLIATLGKDAREYRDYTVSNNITYTYKVTAFDAYYNRAASNLQQVTPVLVMVDVKLRLHLPDYTPTTDGIYIAGDFNGWNASSTSLQVPSGATDRNEVEYSFKMMAGSSIQYKYTRGSWSTEAFTSHTRSANDTTDPGNWAYSSTDTNMRLTVANQGGNKMTVDDYVLRWVDMPMMIALPRTSYGQDIAYTTKDSTMDLKAVVPFGVAFTVNGQPLPAGAMDAQGRVQMNGIALNPGVNTFVLHIEPTEETLSQPWYTDKGRAGQATKTLTIQATREQAGTGEQPVLQSLLAEGPAASSLRTGQTWQAVVYAVYSDQSRRDVTGEASYESDHPLIAKPDVSGLISALSAGTASIRVQYGDLSTSFAVTVTASSNGGNGNSDSNSGSTGQTGDKSTVILTKEQLKPNAAGYVNVELPAGTGKLLLPAAVGAEAGMGAAAVQVHADSLSLTIPAEVLKEVAALLTPAQLADGQIILTVTRLDEAAAREAAGEVALPGDSRVKLAGDVYDLTLAAVVKNGETKPLTLFAQPLKLALKLNPEADGQLAGVYVIHGNSGLEYVGGRYNNGLLEAELTHFSRYAALEYVKNYKDIPADHWVWEAVRRLSAKHVVEGVDTGSFAPDTAVTRAQFAAMLVRAMGWTAASAAPFADVASDAWYAQAVAAAYEHGVADGTAEQRFSPEATVTREEMAVMIVRAYGKATGKQAPSSSAASFPFADAASISYWAADSVKRAAALELLHGQEGSLFAPAASTTRAESAQVMMNLLFALKIID